MDYSFNGKEYDIILGDCLQSLKTLPDACVNTIVTSPPYFNLRSYDGGECEIGREQTPEEFIEKLVAVFREARRVLKDDGTLWVNMGDSYSGSGKGPAGNLCKKHDQQNMEKHGVKPIVPNGCKPKDLIGVPWMLAFALRNDGWYLRSDIIWEKPNTMPSSVTDRVSCSHEYIFMLSKNAHYYFDYEAIEEPANYDGRKDCLNKGSPKYSDSLITADGTEHGMAASAHQRWKFKAMPKFGGTKYPDAESGADGTYSGREWEPKMKNLDESKGQTAHSMHKRRAEGLPDEVYAVRRKRDVWSVPTHGYSGAHFATYPEELIEPCILAGCPVGGVVLDPFNGSGTTGCVAIKNHRKYIGLELNPDYVALAHKRIDSETAQQDFFDVLGVQK